MKQLDAMVNTKRAWHLFRSDVHRHRVQFTGVQSYICTESVTDIFLPSSNHKNSSCLLIFSCKSFYKYLHWVFALYHLHFTL